IRGIFAHRLLGCVCVGGKGAGAEQHAGAQGGGRHQLARSHDILLVVAGGRSERRLALAPPGYFFLNAPLKMDKSARIRNTKNRIFAMPAAPAAIPPKPSTAAMIAMTKNTTA